MAEAADTVVVEIEATGAVAAVTDQDIKSACLPERE
jgi:hypothetical protein